MNNGLNKSLRITALAVGILLLVLTIGLVFQLPWAISLWPWPDSPLSYLFIGSILAAVTVAVVWIGWIGEWGALPAGALNVFVIAVTTSMYFLLLYFQGNHPLLLVYGVIGILIAFASGATFLWSRRIPLSDTYPTPLFVRYSFGLFMLVLILAGGALIFRLPIFPWPLHPDSSVIFGCIFIGDAFYFFYGLLYPRWHNAQGQLLSFLAYDLVLIFPFLGFFASVQPEHRLSLILYVAVLLYSGILAIYYLFFAKKSKTPNAGSRTVPQLQQEPKAPR
jgi:hypothetical protein